MREEDESNIRGGETDMDLYAPVDSLVKPRRWKFYTGKKVWVWVRTRKGDVEKKMLPACVLWGDLTQQNTFVYDRMFWRFYRLEV